MNNINTCSLQICKEYLIYAYMKSIVIYAWKFDIFFIHDRNVEESSQDIHTLLCFHLLCTKTSSY